MAERLYWNTVKPLLKDTLTILMQSEVLQSFRLVGGTSLSLQVGHRVSDDIDLFTDEPYDSVDFVKVDKYLRKTFQYVSDRVQKPVGMGMSYLVGSDKNNTVKLDLFYTDRFIQRFFQVDSFRLATVEEILAMKIDIVQRKARKKDFWDIHEFLETYTPEQMIALHKQRYPYSHDEQLIRLNFIDFSHADEYFDPICLKGKYWELLSLTL